MLFLLNLRRKKPDENPIKIRQKPDKNTRQKPDKNPTKPDPNFLGFLKTRQNPIQFSDEFVEPRFVFKWEIPVSSFNED